MQRPLQALRDKGQPTTNRRGAFSLIELIVVILIIAILSSLLLVGVQAAVGRARLAAVTVDVKNLEQGIKEFQSKFGVTDAPPSSLILFEKADDWADFSAGMNTQQNAALIRRLWPNFLKANGKPDINNDGVVDANDNFDIDGDATTDSGYKTEVLRLNGAECLAFFLGGIMEAGSTSGTYIPRGFSANPTHPFFRPVPGMNNWGSRIGPFADLKPSRLVDDPDPIAGALDNMPVYIDAFPGSTNPYQYFSAYGGRGYRLKGVDTSAAAKADDERMWISTTEPTLYSVYLQKDNESGSNEPTGTAWNAKTFQIISAGADGQWGIGGEVNDGGVPTGTGIYRSYDKRSVERDNVTNFKGGPLN